MAIRSLGDSREWIVRGESSFRQNLDANILRFGWSGGVTMYIRCWGSRGSIPVSGKEYIRYGGDTTCMEIHSSDGRVVVIDAGTGIRALGNHLMKGRLPKSLDMLFTHAHLDHLMGFPFFAPIYTKGLSVTVRGYPFDYRSYKEVLNGIIRAPYFPIELKDKDFKASFSFRNLTDRPFSIGTMKVSTIPLNHPKDGGTGFRFEEDGKSFVFLTDNELDYDHHSGVKFEDYVEFSKDADLLIHDAEYDKKDYKVNRSWGHSLFTDAVRLGLKANVKQLGLFHLNNRRTDEQVDAMVAASKKSIARDKSKMKCFAVGSSFETTL